MRRNDLCRACGHAPNGIYDRENGQCSRYAIKLQARRRTTSTNAEGRNPAVKPPGPAGSLPSATPMKQNHPFVSFFVLEETRATERQTQSGNHTYASLENVRQCASRADHVDLCGFDLHPCLRCRLLGFTLLNHWAPIYLYL